MVFESIVADILNRYLGEYVENLDKGQLKIGIWGGKDVESDLFWFFALLEKVEEEKSIFPVTHTSRLFVYAFHANLVLSLSGQRQLSKQLKVVVVLTKLIEFVPRHRFIKIEIEGSFCSSVMYRQSTSDNSDQLTRLKGFNGMTSSSQNNLWLP